MSAEADGPTIRDPRAAASPLADPDQISLAPIARVLMRRARTDRVLIDQVMTGLDLTGRDPISPGPINPGPIGLDPMDLAPTVHVLIVLAPIVPDRTDRVLIVQVMTGPDLTGREVTGREVTGRGPIGPVVIVIVALREIGIGPALLSVVVTAIVLIVLPRATAIVDLMVIGDEIPGRLGLIDPMTPRVMMIHPLMRMSPLAS